MVFIYIDESGSINNQNTASKRYFVISLIYVLDKQKTQKAYKRFVSSNLERLRELDKERVDANGKVIREGGKMFRDGKFRELKGAQFDAAMKRKFLGYFGKNKLFEVFFIKIDNTKLDNKFCANTARGFNYVLRLALNYYINKGFLPNEECFLQIDERNERTESKFFLEDYLNTELILNSTCNGPFSVQYFDSAINHYIQLADVYANWYYSHLITNAYTAELTQQESDRIIRDIFVFPPNYH